MITGLPIVVVHPVAALVAVAGVAVLCVACNFLSRFIKEFHRGQIR